MNSRGAFRRPRGGLALALVFAAAACASEPSAVDSAPSGAPCASQDCVPACVGGECRPLGWTSCPSGFSPRPEGAGCVPVLPAEACTGASRALLGKPACVPIETTCAKGFEPRADGVGCIATLPATACLGATRARLGETSCAPVGTCSAAPPADADTFVDPSFATVDANHFRTITDALASASAKVIAIAKGTYAERLTITRPGTRLVGRCAADVVIDGSTTPKPENGINVDGVSGVRVEGVTLRSNKYGLAIQGGATVDLADVIVEKNVLGGLLVSGPATSVRVSGSLVREGYAGNVSQGTSGIGAEVNGKATLTLEDTTVALASGYGLSAATGGTLDITRTVILETEADAIGAFGIAIIQRDATLRARTTVVSGAGELGIGCFGGSCSVEDAVVERVTGSPKRAFGRGVQVIKGTTNVSRTTIAACAQAGLWAETQAKVSLTGSTVRQIGGGLATGEQAALAALDRTSLTVNDTTVYAVSGVGLRAQDAGTIVNTDGLSIVDLRPRANAEGRGLDAWHGAHVSFKNGSIERVTEAAVLATEGGTEVSLEGVSIDGTLANRNKTYGFGMMAILGSTLRAERVATRRSLTFGVGASGAGTTASFSNVYVSETGEEPTSGRFGRGLQVQEGASVVAKGITLEANREAGASVAQAGSRLDLSEASIVGTRPAKENGAGRGIGIQNGAVAMVRDTVIDGAVQVGVFLGGDTEGHLDHVRVSRTAPDGAGEFGDGIVSYAHARVRVVGAHLLDNRRAGLSFGGAGVTVDRSRIEGNAIGIVTGAASTLEQLTTLPAIPEFGRVLVSSDTVFRDNQTRVGGASVAPPPLDEVLKVER